MIGTKAGIYNQSSGVPFSFGNAYSTDGVNDVITFPNITSLNNATNFSIHLWCNVAADQIMTIGAIRSSTQRFQILKFSNNTLFAIAYNGMVTRGTYNFSGLEDTNVLISLVYNGFGSTNSEKLKLYVNGNVVTMSYDGTIPPALPSGLGPEFNINNNLGTYGMALYNEISLVNASTPASEILALYNGGNGADAQGVLSNLISYYKCNETTGDTVLIDELGNNNGTITGGEFVSF